MSAPQVRNPPAKADDALGMPPGQSPRVAFVSPFLTIGGTSTHLCNLCGGLTLRGVAVRVLNLRTRNELAADFRAAGVEPRLEDDRRLTFEERMADVLEELRRFAPSAVVAWFRSASFESLRYVPAGVLRIAALHNDVPREYAEARPYAPWVDCFVGVSERVTEEIRTFARAGGSAYIRTGVRMPAHAPARDFAAGEPLRIVYVGRLVEVQKHVRCFARIHAALCAAGVPFAWTIVGEGPERAYLEGRMRSADPRQRTCFAGAVPPSRVGDVLAANDVFILASDFEGMPLSLIEAMGHGLVPVVSRVRSGVEELVDETCGCLADAGDVAAFASHLIRLHRNPDRASAMSRAAIERVAGRFSPAAESDAWLELLRARAAAGPPAEWPVRPAIRPPLVHAWPWAFRQPFKAARFLLKRMRAPAR